MYLKCIEVQGFKSFAQKILFEFHNGITGIVGPNGSGKSNVADAVRWVLGEQSAKQLRGGNMQDVIFAGTQARKPLSFASVAITLDNSDHQLGVDFEEVTVTRRLYRSGESEYLINGSACRLRDINEMFYDTGIGKEGYSIIGQGQIDKILSGKPEERRELFDEAAGIVKFKRRKNATVKKLADEQANLVRVTDILTELTRQVRPLERQAETARIYLARRERQKYLDVHIFLSESEKLAEELKELEEKLSIADQELARTTQEYEQIRSEYEKLSRELEELEKELEELRSASQNDALKKEQLEGQIRVVRQQLQSGQEMQESLKQRLDALTEDISAHEAEKKEFSSQEADLKREMEKGARLIREKDGELESLRERILDCENSVRDGKNEIISLMEERANTKGKAQRFQTLMEQIDIRRASVTQRLLVLKGEEEALLEKQHQARKDYQAVTASLQDLNFRESRNREESEKLAGQLEKENAKLQDLQAAFHRENSRLESLRNMAERYDGYGGSIRRVMEQKASHPGVEGVVADLIQTKQDYELAVETALGGSIQNIVTDNEITARDMIGFLKKNRYGRATFLPLDSLADRGAFSPAQALKEKGVVGLASSLVRTEPRYQKLSAYLLGRTLVVDGIDEAIAIARKYRHSLRIVTLEGESLSPGGSMTGGAFRNNANLLGRRREIEELEKQTASARRELEQEQKNIAQLRQNRQTLREELAQIQDQLRILSVEQNTVEMNQASLQESAQQLEEQRRKIQSDQSEIKKDSDEAEREKESVQKELALSERDEQELDVFIQTRTDELAGLRQEESGLVQELEKLRMEDAAASQRLMNLQENGERISQTLSTLKQEQDRIHESLRGGESEQKEWTKRLDSVTAAIKGLADQIVVEQEKIGDLQKQKEEKNSRSKTFFDRRDELSVQMNRLDKECFRLRTQKEKQEEARENRINYLWEEYEITPVMAQGMRDESMPALKEMKKELAGVREEIRSLGPVNVSAIEEYRELSERHAFLSAQYDDLKKAEATLEGIIAELDEGMRRQFKERFQAIQLQFNKTFQELFGGGKGTLELEEEADILEAGIHIISQPPGKKLQNMMQLSGGEKALTAIALLFAIQNLKPSPFCLLDEIEAALDDSNVGRFAAYLQKLTENTQFIVITHRRGTMNAADRLYGITMQEKGVSALVSVDLVENQLS